MDFMKTYSTVLVPRARAMRREMTSAERHLWYRCLTGLPWKFRRQRPFGRFIVDFYCPSLKLVIEVDGDSHFDEAAEAYDRERTTYLNSLGLEVVRFTNLEVIRQTEAVSAKLHRICMQRETPPQA
jgi:very-short-patch-repair endonuclease